MTTIWVSDRAAGQLWVPRVGHVFQAFVNSRAVPAEARTALEENCIRILGQGQAPQHPGRRTGLVLGAVQAGKTMSFTGVTALARDNGFSAVIILAGTKNNLVGQTSSRLQRDLGLDDMHPFMPEWRPIDFGPMTQDGSVEDALRQCLAPAPPSGTPAPTALITLLKRTSSQPQGIDRLAQIIERLDGTLGRRLGQSPVLVIDDEADEASLDASRAGRPPTPTYLAINRLRDALPSHTYLQYTATPQAVLLLGLLDQLAPEFVHLLEPGDDYCGGDEFFGTDEARRDHITVIPSSEVAAIRAAQPSAAAPPSLREALLTYVCAVGLELLNGPPPRNRSMLVHPHVERVRHQLFEDWVRTILRSFEVDLRLDDDDPNGQAFRSEIAPVIRDLCRTTGYPPPAFGDLRVRVQDVLQKTTVMRMNADSPEEPRWGQQFSVIAVGGNKLQRGYTLNGLITTWMPRSPGQMQIDTILQRGRFFGYHRPYLPLCRVFLSEDLKRAYEQIVPHERMLWRSLEDHKRRGEPLGQWRRAMLLDRALRPCRASVVRLPTNRLAFGANPEWFTQSYHPGRWTGYDQRLLTAFLRRHDLTWTDWPGSERWTDEQRARYTVVDLREVLEQLLAEWRVADAESARLSALLLQIAAVLDSSSDERCVVVQMNHAARQRAHRGVADDGRISQLSQGRNPRGGYPGDRALHDPADPRLDNPDTTTVALYRLDLTRGGTTVHSDVPFVAVRPAGRLARPWLIQQ